VNRTAILVNRESEEPLHRQLSAALREAILCGKLAPGERILSSRDLQTHLGLSRNTVVDALGQLHSEGYLVTVRGVGTFVAQHASRRDPHHRRILQAHLVPTPLAATHLEAESLAQNVRENVPFRLGIPALDLFPSTQFKRCFRQSDWTAGLLDYPDPLGYEPLREAIARRLQQTRGVACSPDQILITSGAQAALALIVRVLLRRGDRAVVEDPGYPNVRAILQAHGARIVTARVDRDGVDPAAFTRCRARLAYVTPSHQYPTGVVLSLQRRLALLDWAESNDAWIVEDDYDSEFNYSGRVQPALHGLARGHRVLYVGTFSKVLSPALRIAYVAVPLELQRAFAAVQRVMGGAPDTIVQAALARFVNGGHLSRHITRTRRIYDERRRFVGAELAAAAGGSFRVRDSLAGLHLVVEIPDGVSDVAVSECARRRGLIVPPLSRYFHGKPQYGGLLVGFASTSIPRAKEAITVLSDAYREASGARPATRRGGP
jgi:GntR family transcriptional regulator/MocR family aminotransferase